MHHAKASVIEGTGCRRRERLPASRHLRPQRAGQSALTLFETALQVSPENLLALRTRTSCEVDCDPIRSTPLRIALPRVLRQQPQRRGASATPVEFELSHHRRHTSCVDGDYCGPGFPFPDALSLL